MSDRSPRNVDFRTRFTLLMGLLLLAFPGFTLAAENPAGKVPPPPGPFDLQACYEMAVLQSETLGLREEDIRIAQARFYQAIAGILPKVHVITTETLQNSAGFSDSIGGSGSSSSGSSGGGNSKDRLVTRLNVRQPIFSGLRDSSVQGSQKATTEARRQDKRRAYQTLYLDVSDTFYQILMYEGDVQVLQAVQASLQGRAQELDRRIKLGRSRTGEALAATAELASTRVTLEQIRGLLGASKEFFSFLTGLPVESMALKDSSTLPGAEALEYYLSHTQERPDILAAIQMGIATRKNLSTAKGEHWPTISAEGNYYLTESPEANREWNILLTADLPLFEGGAIEARVREQKALVRASELSLSQLRRTANKDVRVAYNNFLASAAEAASLQELQRAAEESYDIQQKDYLRGVTSNLDVLQSLTNVHDARRRLLDSQMNARANLIRLHVAAGTIEP